METEDKLVIATVHVKNKDLHQSPGNENDRGKSEIPEAFQR